MTDYETGMQTRREVLGDAHVDRALAGAGEVRRAVPGPHHPVRLGGVWSRSGLDRRMRSAITLTALICMHAEHELAMHVRAARRNGLTVDEIREVILHSAVYAGVPAANAAFRVARETLAEAGELG